MAIRSGWLADTLKKKFDLISGFAHQYDGFMLRKQEDGFVKKAWSKWTGSQLEEKRQLFQIAVKEMMPSWDGFCLAGKDASLGPTLTGHETIKHVETLYKCMSGWPLCDDIKDWKNIFTEVSPDNSLSLHGSGLFLHGTHDEGGTMKHNCGPASV